MEKDLIYPKVEENIVPSAPLIGDREFNDILDKEKMNSISDKIKAIHKDLNHFCKLRKRWKAFKTISKIGAFVVFTGSEAGSIILSIFPLTGIFCSYYYFCKWIS